jgi:Rieske Fe-S protein
MSKHLSKPPDARRRSFLKAGFVAVNTVAASALGIPIVGYLLGPLFRKRELQWVEAGNLSDFSEGDPQARRLRFTQRNGFRELEEVRNVWIHAHDRNVTVFSSECTHVGCNVHWKPGREQFVCPCHGGVFSKEGEVLDGPPPRPLEQLPSRIENDTVYVQV